jgi:thiol-disulfide isomerase/thioredoxin
MRTALLALTCSLWIASAADAPKLAAPFTIQRVGSPSIQLSQYRGKVVLVAFMSTTCPHCQQLTRELTLINKEYEARGVQILGCVFNPNANLLVSQFIASFQPSFPVGFSDNNTVTAYFGRSPNDPTPFYVPHLLFVDRTGHVQGDYAGESDFMKAPDANIRAQLDKMLKAPTTSAKNSKTK